MSSLNELAGEIHENAINHGWWDEERGLPEIIALCHSELSEALEEYRAGRPMIYFPCNAGGVCCEEDKSASCGSRPYNPDDPEARCSVQSKKPEGIAVEMVDCAIRILDYLAHEGLNIDDIMARKMAYNKTRPYRHGGKAC